VLPNDEVSLRMMTMSGIDPISAIAIAAPALLAEIFAKGRDFAAPLALRPLQDRQAASGSARYSNWATHAQALSSSAVARWCPRPANAAPPRGVARGAGPQTGHAAMVALANKMARIAWSLLVKQAVSRSKGGYGATVGKPRFPSAADFLDEMVSQKQD
jgi:transposase